MADEKPKGYLAKHGAQLISNGYRIVPIMRGSKRPPFDGWQKMTATLKDLRGWVEGDYSRAGVGIITRNTPAVDVDVLDAKVAAHMSRFVQENFGFAPVRVGLAPKTLLLFQSDTPFPKLNSQIYEDPFGDPDAAFTQSGNPVGHLRKIEILGDGQQFVAFAKHPDTGKPYVWTENGDPLEIRAADLPTLSLEEAQSIIAEFDRVAIAEGWTPYKAGRSISRLTPKTTGGKVDHDDIFASDKARTDISDDDLRRKLLLVPGHEDYETWLQVGMALWHQYHGEELGLQLWHEWSEQANNYDPDALDAKWETFDATDKGREPVTARLIIKLADEQVKEIAVETFREIKEELGRCATLEDLRSTCEKVKHIEFDVFARSQIVGLVKDRFKSITNTLLAMGTARDMVRYENPESKEVPKWLEGWVYCTQDKGFYSRTKRYDMGTEAFNAAFSRFMLTKRDVLEGKANPETLPAAFALNNKQIPIVRTRMYLPGEDDLFSYNSKPYVNSYSDLNIPDVPTKLNGDERDAVETVKGHFGHLFADETDRRVLLDAIAFLVQNPGQRLNWAILLQGTEKDGKTFFAGLMAAVLGADNINNLPAQAMEEKYNSWSEGAQVVFFEEIKLQGHNRFDVLNKVKPLITNTMISVRRMQTDIYQVVNTATYFLTTNFRDALPLDMNDTRYFVLFSRFQREEQLAAFLKKDPTYYDRLYAALEYGGALRKWLLQHKISPTFSPMKRAPQSKAKAEMVRYSQSEEAAVLQEILATVMRVDLCSQIVNTAALADEMVNRGSDVPYGKAMNKLLLDAGFTKLGKVRIGTETPNFWSRTPEKFLDKDGVVDTLAVRNWIDADL